MWWGLAAAMAWLLWIGPATVLADIQADGAASLEGWFQEGGIWKYRSGDGDVLRGQWLEDGGSWYYLDEDGHMATGWTTVDGMRYCFQPTGEWMRGWCMDWDSHTWYFYDSDHTMHTGWLFDGGAWYWMDGQGRMFAGGYRTIEGVKYYFFNDGQLAANQYIGFRYHDKDGLEESSHDVQLVGGGKVSQEDRDMVSDALYLYPRRWIARFVETGWSFQYYTEKSFFEAPDTDLGVYYKYYDLDTRYRKLKLCRSESMVRAFGEYVAYASGTLEEGNEDMRLLRSEQVNLDDLLEIPDYYDSSDRFFFGAVCEAYFDDEKREQMETLSPEACRVLEGILNG